MFVLSNCDLCHFGRSVNFVGTPCTTALLPPSITASFHHTCTLNRMCLQTCTHTYTYTLTHTQLLNPSHTHSHSLSLSHTHISTCTHSHTHIHSHTPVLYAEQALPGSSNSIPQLQGFPSNTHTHSYIYTHTLSLSLTHTHTHAHTHTHTHAHTHTHTHLYFMQSELCPTQHHSGGTAPTSTFTAPCCTLLSTPHL